MNTEKRVVELSPHEVVQALGSHVLNAMGAPSGKFAVSVNLKADGSADVIYQLVSEVITETKPHDVTGA